MANINALADDAKLTGAEKKSVLIPQDARLDGAWGVLDAQAGDLGVTTARTAASAARTAWQTYRNGLSPAWNDTGSVTTVDRATFRSTLSAYETALTALQKAISAAAATKAEWDSITGSGKNAVDAGLNPDGSVKAGKVIATSMSADVVNKIVSATASNIAATDAGAVLLSLPAVAVKPSQGGYVHILLSCDLSLGVGADLASKVSLLYARLQRSPAGAATWTELDSWLMGRLTSPQYSQWDGTGGYLKVDVDELDLRVSATQQFIDVPPVDGNYDYRWLVSKTPDGTGQTSSETKAGVAQNARGLAISVKVGS